MATPFETYIQTELPLRSSTLLPAQCGGYDADPNLGGAPSILQNAPVGTFYWEETAAKFWRKKGGPGEWSEEGGGGGGGGVTQYATEIALLAAAPAAGTIGYAQDSGRYWFRGPTAWAPKANLTVQIGALAFPIDYATGTDPVAGTVFCRQADIDAYLLTKGITYFKTIIGCFRCLPDIVTTYCYFYLQPGVHRPLPITDQYQFGSAFPFFPVNNALIGATRYPLIFQESARLIISPPSFLDASAWETISAAQACTGASNSGSPGQESYLDFAGATFTPGALKGYFVRIPTATPQYITIRDNTATRIALNSNYSGTPTGLNISVVSPATIIRNSFDDIAVAYANATMFSFSSEGWADPGIVTRVVFDSIRIDQYAANTSAPGTFALQGPLRISLSRTLFDHARLRNSGLVNSAGTILFTQGNTDRQTNLSLTQCSLRGNRLATVPASGSVVFKIALSPQKMAFDVGSIQLAQSYLGGCSGSGAPIDVANCYITAFSTMFDDFNGPFCTFGYCWVSFSTQTPRNFFRGGVTCVSILGRLAFNAVFESITGSLLTVTSADGSTSDIFLGYSANGPGGGANTGRHLNFSNNARITIGPNWAATASNLPEIANSAGNGFSLADLRAKWEVYTQIQATLAPAVTVLAISDAVSTAVDKTCYLRYTNATKLLQFRHFSDASYGANVDVTAGGVFMLKSLTASYWCVIAVNAASLPGADATETFRVQPAGVRAHDHVTLYAGA
jgi:hypothetical protein